MRSKKRYFPIIIVVIIFAFFMFNRSNTIKNNIADAQTLYFTLTLFDNNPPTNPPKQNIVMPMVKVNDNCAVDQFVNSWPIGEANTLHAYIRPANNKTMVPTTAYIQRLSFFILISPINYIKNQKILF